MKNLIVSLLVMNFTFMNGSDSHFHKKGKIIARYLILNDEIHFMQQTPNYGPNGEKITIELVPSEDSSTPSDTRARSIVIIRQTHFQENFLSQATCGCLNNEKQKKLWSIIFTNETKKDN